MKKEAALVLVCYAMVYLVWGSTYFFIKAAVSTIPAALVVALRFLSGAFILGLIAWRSGGFAKRPSIREFAGAALIGVLLLLLGNGLITIAEKTIPSYTASLIVSCMPFYIALFNLALYRERISAVRSSGAALGVLGIAALLYDGTSLAASLSPAVLIAVAGALAWGLGTSLAKALPKPANVVASTSIQMLVAGSAALGLGALSDPGSLARLGQASTWSLFGVAYLAVLGSLTLVAYNYLLVKEPSFRISSYSLVNPLIAVLIGLSSGEAASPYLGLGIALVLAGLALMLYGDALRDRLRRSGAETPST